MTTSFRFIASAFKWLRGDRWDAREEARKQLRRIAELRGDPQPQLSKAIASDNIEEVLRLLQEGLDPNAQDKQGETPLMFAAYRDRAEAVKVLLQAGAKPNHQGLNGNTALHLAVDATIDHATQDGRTIGQSELETIRALLQAGAKIDLQNARGQTAVDWARGSERVLQALSDAR